MLRDHDDNDEEEEEEEKDTDELEEEEEDTDELEPTDDSGYASESDNEPEPFNPALLDAELERKRVADHTMRTDFATLGESTATARSCKHFIDNMELHNLRPQR